MPRRQILPHEANRIIGLLQAGQGQRQVARITGVNRSSVNRIWTRFLETGDVGRRPGQGPHRATTAREDRAIHRVSIRERFVTAREIAERVPFQDRRVSTQTVRNRLRSRGLRARRPVRVPFLTLRHRQLRLQYARDHVHWRAREWRRVLFTDESRFCLYGNDGRSRVWRRRGEHLREDCIIPTRAFNGGSVMVWGGIRLDGRTELVVVPHRL